MEKKRCNNFTANEIDVLVSLVEEFKEIIECKKTDTITNSGKEAEWRKIEIKFNAICGSGRTAKMLRGKWDSLKKTIKKEYAEYKQSLYKTGGGPAKDVKLSGVGNRVIAIIGVGATGTISQFDSDSFMDTQDIPVREEADINLGTVSEIVSDNTIQIIEVCPDKVITSTDGESKVELIELPTWKSWTPQQLRQPKSKALQVLNVEEDECGASSREILTTVVEKKSANCTPIKCDTPKGLTASRKRKNLYKSESIPSKIKKQRSHAVSVYEELARKKIDFINFQMTLLKDEAERKEKRLAEKHELEIKILQAELHKKENI